MARRKNFISLKDHNPELALEWHPTKNGQLTPKDISYGSGQKAWWMCNNGHEWEAPVINRLGGSGCHFCSMRKPIIGTNDLATVRPDLLQQWHPEKNVGINPTNFTIHSYKKVWWLCQKGHEWAARISNRCNGTNCPFCSNKKVLVGYNDLESTMPWVASEWHPTKNGVLTAKDVTSGSNKNVWWRCKTGHEWLTRVANRAKGEGCPRCQSEAKTSFPEQAIFFYFNQITTAYNRYLIDKKTEIDIYLPELKIGIEYDGLYYHNTKESKSRELRKQETLSKHNIALIRIKETREETAFSIHKNIIYTPPAPSHTELTKTIKIIFKHISKMCCCSFNEDVNVVRDHIKIYEQYIFNEKATSLSVINPTIAKEWHPTRNGKLRPEQVKAGSNKKAWWICSSGHEWEAVISSRNRGAGCPYCAGLKAIIGSSDLLTLNPELASEWHPTKNENLKPSDVMPASNKIVWWQCKNGHEWKAMVYDRTNGCGCPICSGHKVLVGFNDLATKNPKLATEWHPTKNTNIKPSDITCGSDKKVWWLCNNGHEWEAAISSRNTGYGCPYCAGQRVIQGYNDLLTRAPELAVEWHPTKNGSTTINNIAAGTHKKAWWLGKCGHEWEASIGSRTSGRGCPFCASQKLLVGFNDLETLNPALASEWHPTKNENLKPSDVMPASNKIVWWQCEKGHEWKSSVNTRKRGNGCPYCANQIVLKGYNDLATLNPLLSTEWHPTKNGDLTPSDFMAGSNKKAWWICDQGHEWQAKISSRNRGAGCMACYRLRRKANKL